MAGPSDRSNFRLSLTFLSFGTFKLESEETWEIMKLDVTSSRSGRLRLVILLEYITPKLSVAPGTMLPLTVILDASFIPGIANGPLMFPSTKILYGYCVQLAGIASFVLSICTTSPSQR